MNRVKPKSEISIKIGDPVIVGSIPLPFFKNKIRKKVAKLVTLSTSSIAFKPIGNFTIFILEIIQNCTTVTF